LLLVPSHRYRKWDRRRHDHRAQRGFCKLKGCSSGPSGPNVSEDG